MSRRGPIGLGYVLSLAAGLAVTAACGLTGCGSTQTRDDEGVSAGLNRLDEDAGGLETLDPTTPPQGDDLEAMIAQTAADLEAYLAGEMNPGSGGRAEVVPSGHRTRTTTDPSQISVSDSVPPTQEEGDLGTGIGLRALTQEAEDEADQEVAPSGDREPPLSRQDRITQLTRDLRALFEEAADADGSPAAAAVALAALAALDEEAGTLEASTGGMLASPEMAVVDAASELIRDLRAQALADGSLDPERASALIAAAAERLAGERPLSIATAALCTRVESFGMYDAMADNPGFLAGRSMRALVYVEVDGFTSSEETNIDRSSSADGGVTAGYKVELSQALELYHDADGLLAWKRPAEVTRHLSRRVVRDFFLVDRVTLPATLTVGQYRLKVILRDLADGSVAEATLPIRVVADPNLTTANRRGN